MLWIWILGLVGCLSMLRKDVCVCEVQRVYVAPKPELRTTLWA